MDGSEMDTCKNQDFYLLEKLTTLLCCFLRFCIISFQQIFQVNVLLQIKHNLLQGNPSGCWDWWGYLGLGGDLVGYTYATKHGKQMAGVAHMIEKVANISMF